MFKKNKTFVPILVVCMIAVISVCSKNKGVDKDAPLPPVILSAELKDAKIIIKWEPSPSEDVTTYRIYRNINGSFLLSTKKSGVENTNKLLPLEEIIGETGADGTYFEDSNIELGKTYYYILTSVDGNNNESEYSNEVSVYVDSLAICGNNICEPGESKFNCISDCNEQTLEICNSSSDALRITSISPEDGKTIQSGVNSFTFTVEYNLVSESSSNIKIEFVNEVLNSITQPQLKQIFQGCGIESFNISLDIPSSSKILYLITSLSLINAEVSDMANYIVDGSADWIRISSSIPSDGTILNQGNINISINAEYNLQSKPTGYVSLYIEDESDNILYWASQPAVQGTGIASFQNIVINTLCKSRISVKAYLGVDYLAIDSVGFSVRFSDKPLITINPTSLTFTAQVNGNSPLPQSISIRRCGGTQEVSWSGSVSENWLSLAPPAGTTPSNISVSVDITGLAEGIHNGTITITIPEAETATIHIPVTIRVLNIQVSWVQQPPATMESLIDYSVQYSISGGTSGSWWIQYGTDPDPINNPQGYTTPQSGGMGTYSDVLNLLTCSTNTYYFAVVADVDGLRAYSNIVQSSVTPPSSYYLYLFPSSFSFSAPQNGSNPPPKLLLISELCNNPINWNGSTDTTWLSISPTNGTTPDSVGVLVNISGLNAGTYSGTITINSAQAINSPQIVQVTLDICSDDALEEDDTYLNAKEIQMNGGNAQHLLVDPDYHYFNASQGIQYTIETLNLSHGTDTTLSLFDTDGVTRLAFDDDSGEGFASKIVWTAPANGTYYIMIDAAYQNYKCNSSYDVKITSP